MFIAPIMIFISWQTGNNAWAYTALGFVTLASILRAAEQQQKKAAEVQQTTNGLEDFLKALRARNN